jgi:AcrR family transcriptional regulator
MTARSRPLRSDAARNRDKLLDAAALEFGERGLDAPLEHIARRAGVSIGTLYAHFPAREAFFEAIYPPRLAALDQIAAKALADVDPWNGFAGFIEGLFGLLAADRGFSDTLTQRFPASPDVAEACRRGYAHADQIISLAKDSGQLRQDFELSDLVSLTWAISQVIRESAATAPDAWRRCLAFFLDGLRAQTAHPISVPPMTKAQLAMFSPAGDKHQ